LQPSIPGIWRREILLTKIAIAFVDSQSSCYKDEENKSSHQRERDLKPRKQADVRKRDDSMSIITAKNSARDGRSTEEQQTRVPVH
jgi:hypothetical protein